jgi:hypothetical protein
MKRLLLRIDPQARVHCFYTEAIDLAQIGRLEVRRASKVEFNGSTQQWEVRSYSGLPLYSHPSRANCLEWEHDNLQPDHAAYDKLPGFPFSPLGFEDGLPVFKGQEAYKELFRRFGIPNAAPLEGEGPFSSTRSLFVDDDNDGEPVAYLIR